MLRLLDPITEFNNLRRQLDRVVFGPGSQSLFAAPARFPAVVLTESPDAIHAEFRVPGLDPATLNVSVLRDQLTVSGEKPGLPKDLKADHVHRNERTSGRFARTITLPAEVDSTKVTAQYRNGILHIDLPKVEAAKPRQVAVTVA